MNFYDIFSVIFVSFLYHFKILVFQLGRIFSFHNNIDCCFFCLFSNKVSNYKWSDYWWVDKMIIVFWFVKEHQIEKRYLNQFLVSDPTQLWILKGKTLKDKGNLWQSNDNWSFENGNDGKLIYIKNENSSRFLTANDTLGLFYTKVMEESFKEGNSNQLWIQGNATTEGFFTLQNYGLKQFLSAQTESTLMIIGKFILFDEYFIFSAEIYI